MTEPFALAAESAARIAARTGVAHHDVAVVFGSGWAPAAAELGAADLVIASLDALDMATLGKFATI